MKIILSDNYFVSFCIVTVYCVFKCLSSPMLFNFFSCLEVTFLIGSSKLEFFQRKIT